MTTFHPGTVVRYGNDPALYIRNSDGSWTSLHLGVEGVDRLRPSSHNISPGGELEQQLRRSIERGGATVVYESQPARRRRSFSGWWLDDAYPRSVR